MTVACYVASVLSDTLRPCGPWPANLLCPWDSPGKNSRMGCYALLQGSSRPRDRTCISYVSCIGLGFTGGSDGKESACSAGDPGSIPWWGRSLDKGTATNSSIHAWRIPWTEEPGGLHTAHGVTKSQTRMSD